MNDVKIPSWAQYASDLYSLANDIVVNMYHQPHGYKKMFYYCFNANISFQMSDGSYESQLRLLNDLSTKEVLKFNIVDEIGKNMEDFISINIANSPTTQIFKLTIEPNNLNEFLREYKKYYINTIIESDELKQINMVLVHAELKIIDAHTNNRYFYKQLKMNTATFGVFDYLIYHEPSTWVSRTMLAMAGIKTSRPLNKIVTQILPSNIRRILNYSGTADKIKIDNQAIINLKDLYIGIDRRD